MPKGFGAHRSKSPRSSSSSTASRNVERRISTGPKCRRPQPSSERQSLRTASAPLMNKPLRDLTEFRCERCGNRATVTAANTGYSAEQVEAYRIDIINTRQVSCRCGLRFRDASDLVEIWQTNAREPITLPARHARRMICSCGAVARVEPSQGCTDHVLVTCPSLSCGKSLMSVHEKVRGWVY